MINWTYSEDSGLDDSSSRYEKWMILRCKFEEDVQQRQQLWYWLLVKYMKLTKTNFIYS